MSNAPAKTTATPDRKMREPKEIRLKKSGILVTYDAGYVTADTLAAQQAAGKNVRRFTLYLAQRICVFGARRWTAQEIEESLPGMDFLQLQGAILGGDDEEDEGND